nr:sporulation protein [Acinetobacter amyesii]
MPFNIQLPFETPVTQLQCAQNSIHVWLHTHLDVDWGLNATDRDYIQTYPTALMQGIIQAMQLYSLLSRC